jgi:3-oxoacyl-[acyl-carrier protein] reductase
MSVHGSAIVTGGTSGIGLATARALVREGFEVTLWARDARRGQDAISKLNAEHLAGKVLFQACDVGNADSVQQAVEAFTVRNQGLNILINAAGILQRTPVGTFQPELIARQIDTVLKGTIHTTTALAPHLARARQGVVVNVGSVAGQQPIIGLGTYGAAKAGVAHFTRVMAQELFTAGVRVLCVCPGIVKTSLVPEREYEALINVTPGRRLQTVEEIAQFIVELTRPAYPSLTGAVIDLDDGLGLFLNNRPPSPPPIPAATAATVKPLDLARPAKSSLASTARRQTLTGVSSTASQTTEPVLMRVATVFHQTFGIDPTTVTLATSPEDVARWDSLGNLRLIASLEKEFACSLDINEIMEMVDVGTIVRVMKGKVR